MLFFLSVFSLQVLSSAQDISSSDEIVIKARREERTEERLLASGDVEIRYRNLVLFADRVEFEQSSKEVFAQGNVVIHLGDQVVRASWIRLNLETLRGEMEDVRGRIQPTLLIEAKSLRRINDTLFSFARARVTTCTQPVPRWSFTCSKGNWKEGAYIEMWNPVFSVKNIPLLYLPYIRYPLLKERTTGFLIPQLGHSNQKGLFLSQSFYWAIKRNMDATFTFDLYSARGLGAGLEFRYLLSRDSSGQLNGYYFAPLKRKAQADYLLRFNHRQFLPFGFSLAADVDLQSSYQFLREFDNSFKRAVVWNRKTQVYISRAWASFNFNLRLSRFETYFPSREKSAVTYNLPEASLSLFKQKLFYPLYFSFTSSFRDWKHINLEGTRTASRTLALSPVLTLALTKIPWLFINTTLTNNFFLSFEKNAPEIPDMDGELNFGHNYVLNIELTGPTFYRVYRKFLKTSRLKHLIEPSLVYRYESPLSGSQDVPGYQPSLRIHQLTYSLTNRFLVKKDGFPREILSFALEQSYYFSPQTSPLRDYRVSGQIPEFSDLRGTLRFYPVDDYSIDVALSFNPYYKSFSTFRLGALFGSADAPWFFRLNWFKSINPYREDPVWNRHQIQCYAGLRLPSFPLKGEADLSYNIEEKRLLYCGFQFVYNFQCLDIKGSLRIYYFREKPELQFRLSVGLGDIGKTVDALGGLGF
ncbi:MAG: LPS-assembly protein LptD [Candidatus Aminicenantales bacterium]